MGTRSEINNVFENADRHFSELYSWEKLRLVGCDSPVFSFLFLELGLQLLRRVICRRCAGISYTLQEWWALVHVLLFRGHSRHWRAEKLVSKRRSSTSFVSPFV